MTLTDKEFKLLLEYMQEYAISQEKIMNFFVPSEWLRPLQRNYLDFVNRIRTDAGKEPISKFKEEKA